MGVPATAVAVAGDTLVYTGRCLYRGLTIRETAGAVATVRVFDGTSAAGTLLDTIALAANSSFGAWYGSGGITAAQGIWFEVVAGTVEGSVRVG
jgi:hypothetical protein